MKLDRIIAVRNHKTVYRDGELCMKVFDENFSKADVLNEALNQARIEETALKIPKVLAVTMVEGKWAIISEYIEGKTLDQLMKEDPAHFDEYLERFVRLQMEVHAQRAPQLTQLKDKMQAKISQTDFDATTRYDLHTRLEGMHTHNKVCHGDFNPSNIIITPDGDAYILDWSHVTRGNAAADAARTYLLFWLGGDITGAEKYLDMYCKLTDTAKQYVQKWLPIVAASQTVKGNPKEREFLASWVNVVDYQ